METGTSRSGRMIELFRLYLGRVPRSDDRLDEFLGLRGVASAMPDLQRGGIVETSPKLTDALRLQNAGRLQEARMICRRILVDQPASAATLHVLGLLECNLGSPKEGM